MVMKTEIRPARRRRYPQISRHPLRLLPWRRGHAAHVTFHL